MNPLAARLRAASAKRRIMSRRRERRQQTYKGARAGGKGAERTGIFELIGETKAIGKLSNDKLDSLILNKFRTYEKEVVCSPHVGVDCAAVDLGGRISCAVHRPNNGRR